MAEVGPKAILLFSGKRKSGKDTITDLLFERVKDVAVNLKISAPIKTHFSNSQGLDFNQLMCADVYKEQFRLEMIKWSEEVRKVDYGYFCRRAIQMANGTVGLKATQKPVWIVSDVRRQTDLQWFRENYCNITTVRVYSSEEERQRRGWVFTHGIDDQESECDLDSIQEWDIVIENNSNLSDLDPAIDNIVKKIRPVLETTAENLSYNR